jgi:hypothetical protein
VAGLIQSLRNALRAGTDDREVRRDRQVVDAAVRPTTLPQIRIDPDQEDVAF